MLAWKSKLPLVTNISYVSDAKFKFVSFCSFNRIKIEFFLAGRLHTVVASVRGEANCKLYYQAITWLPLLHMQLPSSTTFFGTLQHGKESQFGDFTVVREECSIVFVSNQLTRCPCIERGNLHCYQRVWNTVIKQNMNWKINYWRFDW